MIENLPFGNLNRFLIVMELAKKLFYKTLVRLQSTFVQSTTAMASEITLSQRPKLQGSPIRFLCMEEWLALRQKIPVV